MPRNLRLAIGFLVCAVAALPFALGLAWTAATGGEGDAVAIWLGLVIMGGVTVVTGGMGGRLLRRHLLTRRLESDGVAGTAEVLTVKTTGVTLNGTGVLTTIRVRVTVPGGTPFPATIRDFVPLWSVGDLPGGTLRVLADADDHHTFVVDWR